MGSATDIAGAVVELAGEGGIEAITIRKVAERTGLSIGAVQHHFPTKDALLLAAVDQMEQQFRDEIGQIDAAEADEVLRRFCSVLGCVDPRLRPLSSVWLAFIAKAAVDEVMGARHREAWRQVERLLADLIESLPERDFSWSPTDQAALLLAVLDGIAISRVTEPRRISAKRAQLLIDRTIASFIR